MKKDKQVATIIIGTIILISLTVIVDLVNLPSKVGLPINSLNTQVLGWVLNLSTALSIAVISYFLIDKWNVRNYKNKTELTKLLLERAYKNCRDHLSILHKGGIPILVRKTDFNKIYNNNSPADRFSETPFENTALILSFAKDGYVSSEEMETFLKIQSDFKRHVSLSVTFYDAPNLIHPTKDYLEEEIDKAIQALRKDQKRARLND